MNFYKKTDIEQELDLVLYLAVDVVSKVVKPVPHPVTVAAFKELVFRNVNLITR